MNDAEASAEDILIAEFGNVNFDAYQALLYRTGAMLNVWGSIMASAGYSEYWIEKTAWVVFNRFFGNPTTTAEVSFEPDQSIPEGRSSSDQRRARPVHGPEGRTES